MSRQQSRAMLEMEGLIPKIRKRGSSTPSSSSSKLHSYRFKRTILVGKKARGGIGLGLGGGGGGGSRSSTPVPTWKMMTPLRSGGGGAIDSPSKYSQKSNNNNGGGPVSARRLAATLWEMNEIPSPSRLSESFGDKKKNKNLLLKKEKLRSSVPSHLSDPSHSPVSERMDRSATGSHQRRSSSTSQRLNPTDHNAKAFDSISSASLMERSGTSILQIETRSRAQTPRGSVTGVRNRLKDVSNALTTSKELLKILNRVWATADQPSSSVSLVSALHTELERARLQVNQLIQEQHSDQNDINYLMKCFAEEKAAWKNKERQAVEAAIDTIAGELEVERKLRRRFESLNKKLGKELAETKESFMKAAKELEREKRAREIVEQVCDELARDVGEDKVVVEELKRGSEKVCAEVEKEREMLHLADMMREERVQMKLSEAKHQFEEKNTAVDKLKKQLESFLGRKRGKEKRSGSLNFITDEDISACLSKSQFSTHRSQEKEDHGEVEDVVDAEEDSAESELHSIELNHNNGRGYKWPHASTLCRESRRTSVDDEKRGRNSNAGQVPRKSSTLHRSISEGVEWGIQGRNLHNTSEVLDGDRITEIEKQAQRKSTADEMRPSNAVMKSHRDQFFEELRDQLIYGSRSGSGRDFSSPTRDPRSIVQERTTVISGSGSKSRLGETRGEGQSARRSKW